MDHNTIKSIFSTIPGGTAITARGWIRTRRDSSRVSFVELNDGSSFQNLQVVLDHDRFPSDILSHLTLGTGCSIAGTLEESPAKGQSVELIAMEVTIHGKADQTYPLQKKRHTFEYLREIAHLRPRAATFGAVNRMRNTLSMAVHSFFQERDFHYVQTPIITASDCEGAGELFRVTTLETIGKNEDFSHDFFGQETSLTVSGQLEGEVLAMALGRIYTFGPTFRAENSNTSRHLAEFWMVEPEMAFAELEDVISLAEEMVRHLCSSALNAGDDMDFFNTRIKKGIIDELSSLVNASYNVMTYTEAVESCQKSGKTFQYPVEWGLDLQSEHERYLAEELCKGPVFIIDYPLSIKPFYMKCNDDGKTVRAMDLLVPGIGEIIGGSQREDDLAVLTNRMEETGINPHDYSWYLDTRRYGSVPHGGFGLGFERFIQFVTGMQNIRDVIPFPRTPKNASF